MLRDQRRTIYAAELNLVRLEAQRGSLPRMRELLMRQIPGLEQEDLRGFEWNYWYRFLHRAQELRRFDDLAIAAGTDRVVMVPGGAGRGDARRPDTDCRGRHGRRTVHRADQADLGREPQSADRGGAARRRRGRFRHRVLAIRQLPAGQRIRGLGSARLAGDLHPSRRQPEP